MKRENGRVIIDISDEEYVTLMIVIGYATGARSNNEPLPLSWIQLVDAINKDNPNWTPYCHIEKEPE